MSFRITRGEPLDDAVRRIVGAQIGDAIAVLKNAEGEEQAEAVHAARVHFKKTRALLRLVRSGMEPGWFSCENGVLRDAGRSLAAVRDAGVLLRTIDRIAERSALPATRRHLAAAAAKASEPLPAIIVELLPVLRDLHARARQWPLTDLQESDIRRGMQRAYKRGRRGCRAAAAHSSTAVWHEWRKDVKYLWAQLCVLRPACARVFRELARQSRTLWQILGREHDLALLIERAHSADIPPAERETLIRLVEKRRPKLQNAALILGTRFYHQRPGQFGKEIGGIIKDRGFTGATS